MTDMLIAYVGGDKKAGRLWLEGVDALYGKQHLTPSVGLWKMLGRGLAIEETAAEDVMDDSMIILASLNRAQWRIVLRHDRRGEILEVATAGDPVALWRYLESIGVPRGID